SEDRAAGCDRERPWPGRGHQRDRDRAGSPGALPSGGDAPARRRSRHGLERAGRPAGRPDRCAGRRTSMTPPETGAAPAESCGVLRYAVLVALFAALLVLPPLGRRVIVSADEARFAMLAQDMMKRYSWTDAHVRDRHYRNKPLLYPWMIRVLST